MNGWGVCFVAGGLMAFVLGWATSALGLPVTTCTLSFSNGYRVDAVPVVTSKRQQAKGLSGRKTPGPGMLFDFVKPEQLAFWMKDTDFPLSIGFFDGRKRLIRSEQMEPKSEHYHLSLDAARFALELPVGSFQAHGVTSGTTMYVYNCKTI